MAEPKDNVVDIASQNTVLEPETIAGDDLALPSLRCDIIEGNRMQCQRRPVFRLRNLQPEHAQPLQICAVHYAMLPLAEASDYSPLTSTPVSEPKADNNG